MSKKKQEKEADPGAGLLVMMVSLNLILLIFFVYLNSMGTDDGEKVKKALGSLAGRFGMLRGGLQVEDGKSLMIPGAPMVGPDFNQVSLVKAFKRVISKKKMQDDVHILQEGEDLVINLSDKVLFPSGRADLHPDAATLLDEIALKIQNEKFPVRVEGYTDNIPISTPRYPSNWELSAARATAVVRYFLEEKKIPPKRMTAVGFGAHRPLVPNDREEDRARNRRVRIVFVDIEA
ncbi:MAG: flagellar motor protein MotB [Nitrospiria bacterium]